MGIEGAVLTIRVAHAGWMHELWEHKIPAFERITVPAYVVASYSNTLHTAGTFRAWRRIASEQKWLRIHNGQERPDYYDEDNREDLRRFFDRFLKGEDNGWGRRLASATPFTTSTAVTGSTSRPTSFRPADVTSTKYYLDGRSRSLSTTAPAEAATALYNVEANPDLVSFVTRFDTETVLVGYPKAHLYVEARGSDDMDLFVLVQKLDKFGTPLQQFTTPNQNAMVQDLTERGASILRYKGSDGRLRVSKRHLDENLSTEDVPAHSFDRVEKLAPGEIVDIDIDLFPIGMSFQPGEQLRFVVSGRHLLGPMMPALVEYTPANKDCTSSTPAANTPPTWNYPSKRISSIPRRLALHR